MNLEALSVERSAESLGLPEIMRVRVATFSVQEAEDPSLREIWIGEKEGQREEYEASTFLTSEGEVGTEAA